MPYDLKRGFHVLHVFRVLGKLIFHGKSYTRFLLSPSVFTIGNSHCFSYRRQIFHAYATATLVIQTSHKMVSVLQCRCYRSLCSVCSGYSRLLLVYRLCNAILTPWKSFSLSAVSLEFSHLKVFPGFCASMKEVLRDGGTPSIEREHPRNESRSFSHMAPAVSHLSPRSRNCNGFISILFSSGRLGSPPLRYC